MKFGLIGDSVNLASRLEGACRYFGVDIVISDQVVKAMGSNRFLLRKLDRIAVKGKSISTTVYQPLCKNFASFSHPFFSSSSSYLSFAPPICRWTLGCHSGVGVDLQVVARNSATVRGSRTKGGAETNETVSTIVSEWCASTDDASDIEGMHSTTGTMESNQSAASQIETLKTVTLISFSFSSVSSSRF
jgi:hypothetical protein